MSDLRDRILVITDLLLGAAYADDHLHGDEEEAVRELLGNLLDNFELPPEVEARIEGFDPEDFDLQRVVTNFLADPPIQKKKLLDLVAAVHDADEELDLAEDQYLKDLAAALGVPDSELEGMVLEIEVEELRDELILLRKPPPVPSK